MVTHATVLGAEAVPRDVPVDLMMFASCTFLSLSHRQLRQV